MVKEVITFVNIEIEKQFLLLYYFLDIINVLVSNNISKKVIKHY